MLMISLVVTGENGPVKRTAITLTVIQAFERFGGE